MSDRSTIFLARVIFSAVVFGLFLYVVSPFLVPIVMGAVFATLFFPWLIRLERKKISTAVAASVLTLGITVIILLPTGFFVFWGAKTGLEQLGNLQAIAQGPGAAGEQSVMEKMLKTPVVQTVLSDVSSLFNVDATRIVDTAYELAGRFGIKVANALAALLAQLPSILMGFAVLVVSIFFFLFDGRKLVAYVRSISFFGQKQTDQLLRKATVMCRSVIMALVVSALVQAMIFTVACAATDVGNIWFIAFLVVLSSFIPLVGSTPVTFGVATYQFILGQYTAGTVLLLVGLFVTLIDNLIRPIVLKGAGNLHPLLAFIAAFGGLQVIGITGVFLGPIIAGIFVVTIQILTRPH